jgi:hypothetical protein
MIRTETLLIQPTKRQTRELTLLLKNQCELYNAALEERVGSWNWYDKRAVTRIKPSISKYDQFKTLTGLKEVRPEILDHGVTVCRGTLGLSQRKTSVEREASREIVLTAQSLVA